VEVSVDIVASIKFLVGACTFMDISNSIGGLGILGVRALLLSGRELL